MMGNNTQHLVKQTMTNYYIKHNYTKHRSFLWSENNFHMKLRREQDDTVQQRKEEDKEERKK
jgi:hypothetical protein